MPEPRIICPICQSRFGLDQAENAAEWSALVELAARLGPVYRLAREYVEAWRPSQWGHVTIKKRLRVLAELARLWEAKEFVFDGRRYRTDQRRIREALEIVANVQKHGFDSHNYLKKVMTGSADSISAQGETAAEEEAREARKRARGTGILPVDHGLEAHATKEPGELTEAQRALLERPIAGPFGEILDRFKGKAKAFGQDHAK